MRGRQHKRPARRAGLRLRRACAAILTTDVTRSSRGGRFPATIGFSCFGGTWLVDVLATFPCGFHPRPYARGICSSDTAGWSFAGAGKSRESFLAG
jgi:hypothetical protein